MQCLAKYMKTSRNPNPPKPCGDDTGARRRLLQQGVVEWDQMVFDCTTACTDPDNCQECGDTVANECGDVLSGATEEWFVDEADPDGQWNAKCAAAVEVANPELGTQCVVCFFDQLDASGVTADGVMLMPSLLGVVLAGAAVALPV